MSLVNKINQLFKNCIFHWASSGPLTSVIKWILKQKNWQTVYLSSYEAITKDRSIRLAEPSSYNSEAPNWINDVSIRRTGIFSKISAHVVSQAFVSAYSPAVLVMNQLYLPNYVVKNMPRILTDSAGLFTSGKNFLVGRINPSHNINEGILIGGAGAFNWYHFVIECLPKAMLARYLPGEYDKYPFIVPDECRQIPSFESAIKLFSNGRSIVYMNNGDISWVDKLILIDEVSIGPFNLMDGEWPRIDDYLQHDTIMRQFANEFRSKLTHSEIGSTNGRKIFLCRPGERRNYNQNELVEIARGYNFEPVHLEQLSLSEQAKLFAESSFVVGPSGAAWVGMIFRDQPLKGLSWLPKEYRQFCSYSTLGSILGHNLTFLEAKTDKELRSSGEAYVTSYEVCPVEFESALQKMLQ